MTRRAKFLLTAGAAAALLVAGFAPVSEGGRKFVKSLSGQAEIDAGAMSADMDGRGTARVTVNVGQGRVCWDLQDLANLDPLIASHIHNAPSTAAGPIKISFFHFGEAVDLGLLAHELAADRAEHLGVAVGERLRKEGVLRLARARGGRHGRIPERWMQ